MVYQIISFLLITLFYFMYLYKLSSLKKKGIRVYRLGTGEIKNKVIKKSETLLMIFTFLMVVIQFFSIMIDEKWYYIYTPEFVKIIGVIILVTSNFVFYLSLKAMNDNWRIGIDVEGDAKLVTWGVYKYSRNPAFLSFDLMYVGLAMIYLNPLNLIFTIILIWMFDEQIKIEEQVLLVKYSKEYELYCLRVKRYFLFF